MPVNNMSDIQTLYNIIAILVKKLGNNVLIDESELVSPPVATVMTNQINRNLIIKID